MSRIFGYCRISTPKQNIERQVRNILKEYPDAIIVQETFSGTKYQVRRELEKLIRNIRTGDTIVFDSVSRMSRNAEDGFTLYEELYHKGVDLVFLKEPQINTETYRRTLQRTREGIETARRNGKQIGQVRGRPLIIKKKRPVQQLILKHSRTFGGSNSDRKVIAIINASSFIPDGQVKPVRLHVSNNTYYKYKADLRHSIKYIIYV